MIPPEMVYTLKQRHQADITRLRGEAYAFCIRLGIHPDGWNVEHGMPQWEVQACELVLLRERLKVIQPHPPQPLELRRIG